MLKGLSAPRRRTSVGLLAAALVVTASAGAFALGQVIAPVTVGQTADRVFVPAGDVVAIYDLQAVDPFVVEATFRVASDTGAAAATARTGALGLASLTRGGGVVHAAPDGYLIPFSFFALPRAAVAGVIGSDVSGLLDPDTLVLNEMTAGQIGAQIGDVVNFPAVNGTMQAFRIAGIKPYSQIGGSDVVFTTAAADRLGWTDDTRTVIWGITSRQAIDAALQAAGLVGRKDTRVSRSWDLADPDDTVSTPRAKQLLGEPWYLPTGGDAVTMHPTWRANNLPPGRELLNDSIRIEARCHLRIVADLRAALAAVAGAGLGGAIDVANANTYGGCYNPRYSRISGFLSRHAYGMAIDFNTTTNCQGCVPRMNCDVVRIFRRHGFAWGGNFRQPDGMHFEWVGERRDQISYPSTYCPNLLSPTTQSFDPTTTLGNTVLMDGAEAAFADPDH